MERDFGKPKLTFEPVLDPVLAPSQLVATSCDVLQQYAQILYWLDVAGDDIAQLAHFGAAVCAQDRTQYSMSGQCRFERAQREDEERITYKHPQGKGRLLGESRPGNG